MPKMSDYTCNLITNTLIKKHAEIIDNIRSAEFALQDQEAEPLVGRLVSGIIPNAKQHKKDIESAISELAKCGCEHITLSYEKY